MEDYRAVHGSLEISKSIADFLELTAPQSYSGFNRAQTIHRVNDILQGRTAESIDTLFNSLMESGGALYPEKLDRICAETRAFLAQKSLLTKAYTKSSSKEYKFKMDMSHPERHLKIINQRLFDLAAKAGFPPGFFRESYFDRVIIYCIPDQTDFNFSVFQDCTFAVCRIREATFDGTSFDTSTFDCVDMRYATFFYATMSHTHFYDSGLTLASFTQAHLKSCHFTDCTLDRVGFQSTTLDGCGFHRVTPSGTRSLETATITMSGATNVECKNNRGLIFEALKVPDPSPHNCSKVIPNKRKHTSPER